MRKTVYAAGALSMLAALTFAAPAQAGGKHDGGGHDSDDALLSVLHAVPGLTVDVWVDGKLTLDDFKPGTLAGPLTLDDGSYKIAITAADATSADDAVIGPVRVNLKEGRNYTAVAHLDASGDPTATLFKNSISASPKGEGKLTVRHVAAAPAVDVLAGDTAVIEDLKNAGQKVLTLDAGTVPASVAAAGTTGALIGPADVPVTAGKNTIVYAWGSLKDNTLGVAVQVIDSAKWRDHHHHDR